MSIPHSKTKTTQIAIRLTPEEKEILIKQAASEGMPDLSKWVRHLIDVHVHQRRQHDNH